MEFRHISLISQYGLFAYINNYIQIVEKSNIIETVFFIVQ